MSESDKDSQAQIAKIGDQFAIKGSFVDGYEIETGHINTTYCATYEASDGAQQSYILQRINAQVFKDPDAVMTNVERVTRHIREKCEGDQNTQTLTLFPSKEGRAWLSDECGGMWRCYNYITGCQTYDVVEDRDLAFQVAKAFGKFQELVSDLPSRELVETIPDFHHTRKRYERLLEVIAQDPKERLAKVEKEVAFVKERKSWVGRFIDLLEQGELVERITHNDTKVNNVMIDQKSAEAVCVIDLDTVMPGLSLYDFGDLVRSATSPVPEDEVDLRQVEMRMPIFQALVEGYLKTTRQFLSPQEIQLLPFAGKLMALEVGIRFLTDYLEGDVYFRTSRPEQNLDRCRTQLRLVESIEAQEEEMLRFVESVMQEK